MSESFNQATDVETLNRLAIQRQKTDELLDALYDAGAFKTANRRQVISFCCACCYLVWDELPPIAQQSLQVAEQHNAGLASEDVFAAQKAATWNFWNTDPICRRGYGWSKTGEAVWAVLCCLTEPTDEPDEEYELICQTMNHCDNVKSGLEETEYQMLIEYFGSGKSVDE